MNFRTYILYSKQIEKYYIGSTSMDISERLRRHNTNHRGYTGQVNDWEIVYFKEFKDKRESQSLERRIKKRGAKRYLDSVIFSTK